MFLCNVWRNLLYSVLWYIYICISHQINHTLVIKHWFFWQFMTDFLYFSHFNVHFQELSQPCLPLAVSQTWHSPGLQAMEDCWPWPTKPPPPTTQQQHPRRPGRNRRHPCEAAMRCGVACGSGKGDGPPISGMCSKGKPHENSRIWKPFHPID